HVVDLALSFALTTLLFAMIYKVIPGVRIAWRDVWVGAAVTAALFALGKWLIGLYIGKSSVTSAFGAAGSLVVLMLWVYYSAQIFLLGPAFRRKRNPSCRRWPTARRARCPRACPTRTTPSRRRGANRHRAHSRHARRQPDPAAGAAAVHRRAPEARAL